MPDKPTLHQWALDCLRAADATHQDDYYDNDEATYWLARAQVYATLATAPPTVQAEVDHTAGPTPWGDQCGHNWMTGNVNHRCCVQHLTGDQPHMCVCGYLAP